MSWRTAWHEIRVLRGTCTRRRRGGRRADWRSKWMDDGQISTPDGAASERSWTVIARLPDAHQRQVAGAFSGEITAPLIPASGRRTAAGEEQTKASIDLARDKGAGRGISEQARQSPDCRDGPSSPPRSACGDKVINLAAIIAIAGDPMTPAATEARVPPLRFPASPAVGGKAAGGLADVYQPETDFGTDQPRRIPVLEQTGSLGAIHVQSENQIALTCRGNRGDQFDGSAELDYRQCEVAS